MGFLKWLFCIEDVPEMPNKCQCKTEDMILVGYHYTKTPDNITRTYRDTICRKCKRTKTENIGIYCSASEKERDEWIKKLIDKGYLQSEDMIQKIDKYRYGTTLVEIENIIDDI